MTRWMRTALVACLATVLLALPAWAATETPVITGGVDQGQPAVGLGAIAWTVFPKTGYYALANTGSGDFLVNPTSTWGASGGIDGNTLAYQRVNRRGSDLVEFDLATKTQLGAIPYANTKYWEHGVTISGAWVLFGRNNINFGQAKEWQRIVLVNTVTGEKRILAQLPGSAYLNPGQVNGNYAVWEAWTRSSGLRVFRYDIIADALVTVSGAGTRQPYSAAVAADGTMYYSVSGNGCGKNVQIMRRKPDGTTDVIADLPDGIDAWETYEYTDSNPEQDLYYSRIDCNKGWRGDIYMINAADTALPIAPATTVPVGQAVPEELRPLPVAPSARREALPAE